MENERTYYIDLGKEIGRIRVDEATHLKLVRVEMLGTKEEAKQFREHLQNNYSFADFFAKRD